MAFLNKINSKAKANNNTGFGTNASYYGGRFINKNGEPNINKTGVGLIESVSLYHKMLTISRLNFLIVIILFYFTVNLIFAVFYYGIGTENLKGINAVTELDKFGQAFFFSIQTFTTVGYGHISPSGFLASFIAAIEALFGLLSFAIATGLFYGRFSKPKAFIKFSHNALIAPYNEGTALMIRISPFKNTNLTDAEAKITLGMNIEENGKFVNKFYILDLEYQKVNALTLSWTLVHPINENSPLFGLTPKDFENIHGEIIIYIKVFDDLFSTTVVKRTSYIFNEIIYGAKFKPMYSKNKENTKTILHVDQLNEFETIPLG